jgi:peptidoglycan/LPS O-acetylase OafA/YrhL
MTSTFTAIAPAKKTSGRIPSLDGLRALSISLVLFSHCAGTRFFPSFVLFRQEIGHLGVRIFFVISGFLITTILLKELEDTGRISLKWFYLRRALRIFPAAYTYIGVLFFLTAMGWLTLETRDFIHAVTYTVNYEKAIPRLIVHLWSLSVEEQFYFLWPAVLLLAGRRRGLRIAAGVLAAAPVLRILTLVFFPSMQWTEGPSFQANVDALAAGCVLAGIRDWLGSKPAYLDFLRSPVFLIVPVTVAAAFFGQYAASIPFETLSFSAMNIGIALCIDRSVRFESDFVGKVLNWEPLVFVGVLSYSIYVWQRPFLNNNSTSPISWFPLNLVLTAIFALSSYYMVEKPCLDLRKRIERMYAPVRQQVLR